MPSLPNMFSQVLSGAASTPIIGDLMHWFVSVQKGALERWTMTALSRMACSDSSNGRCTSHAVTICEFCRLPTCLNHALVGMTAEVVCLRCVTAHRPASHNGHAKNGHAHNNNQPHAPPKEDKALLTKQYFKVLGLRNTASLETFKERYKKLSKKYHPDRGGDTAKMSELNVAYNWLMKNHYQV